ncbi:MAG: small basic family protein [Firmicutes bacterium]|nr:small basic family protein [Bacillota bacterium]
MLAIVGLVIGILIGLFFLRVQIPLVYTTYVSIAFLAGLDSVLGAIRSNIEKKFDLTIFISGFIVNILLAGLLTYVGDRLGVDLYLAAIVTFGVRIFQNFAFIRRDLLSKPSSE